VIDNVSKTNIWRSCW